MTMRTCLAKIIPALLSSLLVLAALTASGSQQSKSAPARKAAPAAAPAATTMATTLAAMVHAYRETPTVPHRAAIESYAAAHPKEAPFARLALGIGAYETKD